MSKIILVTGGARSGKSVFAEEMIKGFGDSVLYIATTIAADEEMRYRIQRHRALRPPEWDTVEVYRDIDVLMEDTGAGYDAVMVDCVDALVENLIREAGSDIHWDTASIETGIQVERMVRDTMKRVVEAARIIPAPVLFVTNEVGLTVVPEKRYARIVRDVTSRVNTLLATHADTVYLMVSGLPLKLK